MRDLLLNIDTVQNKEATDKVSPDIHNWDVDITKQLFEQHPLVFATSKFKIEWVKQDDQLGYGWGAVILSSQSQNAVSASPTIRINQEGLLGSSYPEVKVAIPIVIKNFELSPLDLFIANGLIYPLTENRLNELFKNSEIFSGIDLSKEKKNDYEDITQLTAPPAEAAYGNYGQVFGNTSEGGMSAFSAKGMRKQSQTQISIMLKILPTITKDHHERFLEKLRREPTSISAFALNNKLDSIIKLRDLRPRAGNDSLDLLSRALPPDIVYFVKKSNDSWEATRISDKCYDPIKIEGSIEEIINYYSPEIPDLEQKLEGVNEYLYENSRRETLEPMIIEELDYKADVIDSDGSYVLMSAKGNILVGNVYTNVVKYDGSKTPWKLFTNGISYSLNDSLFGYKKTDQLIDLEEGDIVPQKNCSWIFDSGAASMPFKIKRAQKNKDYVQVNATDHYGSELVFLLCPMVSQPSNITGIVSSELSELLQGNIYMIPSTSKLINLGNYEAISEDPYKLNRELKDTIAQKAITPIGKNRIHENDPTNELRIITVKHNDGFWTLTGRLIDDICGVPRKEGLSKLNAEKTLMILGMNSQNAENILNKAKESGKLLHITNLSALKFLQRDKISVLKIFTEKLNTDTVDYAVSICRTRNKLAELENLQPETLETLDLGASRTVDDVLSLGFLNEENISTFIDNIDQLRQTENMLAELLLYTRLGLNIITESNLARALKHVNSVIEELETTRSLMEGSVER